MVNVELPEGVVSVGERAFAGALYLYGCSFPSTLERIGAGALSNCQRTEDVYLYGENITIEKAAFSGCSKMKYLYCTGSLRSVAEDAFTNCSMSVYYPMNDSTWDRIAGQDYGGSPIWVYSGADGTRYRADKYSIRLPKTWMDSCVVDIISDRIDVYHTASKSGGYGGFLFSLRLYLDPSEYQNLPSWQELGTIENEDTVYYLVALYPTDVQTGGAAQDDYFARFQEIEGLLGSISGNGAFDYWY